MNERMRDFVANLLIESSRGLIFFHHYQLCNLVQMTSPLYASVSPPVRGVIRGPSPSGMWLACLMEAKFLGEGLAPSKGSPLKAVINIVVRIIVHGVRTTVLHLWRQLCSLWFEKVKGYPGFVFSQVPFPCSTYFLG